MNRAFKPVYGYNLRQSNISQQFLNKNCLPEDQTRKMLILK